MAKPYQTVQQDPWDLISFKQYGNEYFSDQLLVANPMLNTQVNLDGDILVNMPDVVKPVSVSAVVWGGTVRYS
jgi:phage tail protein X